MKKFLFNWRTEDNQTVSDLFDFTRTVLRIPDAHELISQYTILVDDQKIKIPHGFKALPNSCYS